LRIGEWSGFARCLPCAAIARDAPYFLHDVITIKKSASFILITGASLLPDRGDRCQRSLGRQLGAARCADRKVAAADEADASRRL